MRHSSNRRISQHSFIGELYNPWQCLDNEITVCKKTNTIPATQAQHHNILSDSHFLFFCWFLLSHSISLGVDHRYFTALSLISSGCLSPSSSFFCTNSHLSSLCFSVVFCTKQSKNWVSLLHAKRFHWHCCCIAILGILTMFKYCTIPKVNWL